MDIKALNNISQINISEINNLVKEIENNMLCIKEDEILNYISKLLDDSRKSVQKQGLRLIKFKDKFDKEINRVKNMYDFDRHYLKDGIVIGVDEVGRGPLAGPIVSCAVALNLNYESNKDLILNIKDSKKLSFSQREKLDKIIKKNALAYNISILDNNMIDTMGIAWCNNKVLLDASSKLETSKNVDIVLSDGFFIKGTNYPNEAIIKGDAKSASIACASIVAKVFRDNLMLEYAKIYDKYGFENNMGYGTKYHIDAILKNGITDIHRKTFLTKLEKHF